MSPEPEQPLIPKGIPLDRRSVGYFLPEPEPQYRGVPVESGIPYGPKTPGQLADELIAANNEENKMHIAKGHNPKVAHGRTALHLMKSNTFTGEEVGAALEVIGKRAKELGIPAHRVSVNIAQLTTDGMELARNRQRPLDFRERQAGPSSQ